MLHMTKRLEGQNVILHRRSNVWVYVAEAQRRVLWQVTLCPISNINFDAILVRHCWWDSDTLHISGLLPGSWTVRPWKFAGPQKESNLPTHHSSGGELLNFGGVCNKHQHQLVGTELTRATVGLVGSTLGWRGVAVRWMCFLEPRYPNSDPVNFFLEGHDIIYLEI